MFAVIKRKHIVILLAMLVVVVIGGVIVTKVVANADNKKLPIYFVDNNSKVAISFDAAWGSDKTKRIVDICCEYGIKATFFLTGFWIDANQDAIKYIYDHGFEIGNHSANHYNMSGLSKKQIREEIVSVNDKIRKLTGVSPILFRAPFGDYNNTLLKEIENLGMYCIQWNVDSLDWKGLSSKELYSRVVGNVSGGSIVLFHNNSDHIVEALPSIIEGILSKGYKIVCIGDLIYKNNYEIDHEGKQISL